MRPPSEAVRGPTFVLGACLCGRYLKVLLTRCEGSVAISIAAYNALEGAVARHRGIPPYRQTRACLRRVQALLTSVLSP